MHDGNGQGMQSSKHAAGPAFVDITSPGKHALIQTASHLSDKKQPTTHGYVILQATKGDAVNCDESQLQVPGCSVNTFLRTQLHQVVQDALQTHVKDINSRQQGHANVRRCMYMSAEVRHSSFVHAKQTQYLALTDTSVKARWACLSMLYIPCC